MSAIFCKNINLKNIHRFKILLRSINNESCFFRPKSYLKNISACRHVRYFSTAALPKINDIKENTEFENVDGITLQDVDKIFKDMNYAVKRIGRCSKMRVEEALSMVEKLHSASDIHGLYLLRSCGLMYTEKPAERVQMANVIWGKFQGLGITLDIRHFNSLLRIFVDCNHHFLPSEFLASMESSNIEPNKVSYHLLLEKYCNNGDLDGAGEILLCLKEKGLPINESVFKILIKGHMRANDAAGAKQILDIMRSADLSPTAESYTALACAYAEKGNINDVNFILGEAKDNNILLCNKHYLEIILAWSDAENIAVIDELLEKMTNFSDWKQEIANTMLELIHKNMDDVSFKLLLQIASAENNFAHLFVKTLIKCDRSLDQIVSYLEEISNRRLSELAITNAAKAAMDFGKIDLALSLFEVSQKKGVPIRIYNLHLLLSSFKNQEEGIWLTLKKMFQLGFPAEFVTYFEYIFPAVSVSDPETVISKVQETGHSFTAAIDPLFQFYCYHGKFDNALYLVENYPVHVHPGFHLENYLHVCRNIKCHSKASLKVLNYILLNAGVPAQEQEVACGINLARLIQIDHSLFEDLLKMPEETSQWSRKSLDVSATLLRRNDPNLLIYLRRLRNFRNLSNKRRIPRSVVQEEEELKLLKEKGLPVQQYVLDCLSTHLKEKNITRINQLTEELDKLGAQYPPTLLSQLLGFYSQNNDLEKAEKYFRIMKNDCPTFRIDSIKVIEYATLLVKFSKFDDAVNIIKTEGRELFLFGYSETVFKTSIRNLLSIAIETGNSDLVRDLQNSLSSIAETLEANVLYEPLVKIHLYRNDLDSAIDEFEKCVKNHRATPCLKMLLKKCVVTENPAKLEAVIKTASNLVGKEKVLCDLVGVFLETGRKSEAKKILENLRNKSCSSYLEDICSQMYRQDKMLDILHFVNILCVVEHIDRQKIVHCLLKLMSDKNDSKTAQDLHDIVSQSFEPNDENKELFLKLLSKNTQKANLTLPGRDVSDFLQCVKEENAYKALERFQSLKKGVVRALAFSDMTVFLDLLFKNEILNDFSQNVNAMSYVTENASEILKPLFEKYSASGDMNSLIEIADFFPSFARRKGLFNYYLSKVCALNEKHEDLMLELEKRWDQNNKLFSISAFKELLKRPDLEERVINLAKKYLDCKFDLPIAVIWAHYLIHERYEEAEAFYKLHPVSADKVDSLILKSVREQENVTLGMAYISKINNSDSHKRCKERAYGTVLNVMMLKDMHDDASALVVEAQANNINLETNYSSTIITLKTALETKKKEVPFSTPVEEHVVDSA